MTDEEIFDAIGIPADRRDYVADWVHAWSRAVIPGPNMYAIMAAVVWNSIKNVEPRPVHEDLFDVPEWLGVVDGAPWIDQ
jgi:hypothetical protein